MLDLRGRRCVVVGGGAVGLRKVRLLVRSGARVRLVSPRGMSPDANRRVCRLPPGAPRGVELVAARYRARHLAGAALVFACTDDRALNARIAADARRAGALVNAADQPADCDFFVPAALADGDVVIAIGTGGACPALAAALKRRLARYLPPRLGAFAAALGRARVLVRQHAAPETSRRRLLRKLAGPEGYNTFIRAGAKGLLELTLSRLPRRKPPAGEAT
jgi:precorrin-2 dehydrogenase/sirohydrochlorin ferrochelatase